MSDVLQLRQSAEAGEPSPTPFVHGVKQMQRADLSALQKAMPTFVLSDAERAQLFLAHRAELRHLEAVERVRRWLFWGPVLAIVATGVVAGVLYFTAFTALLASQR